MASYFEDNDDLRFHVDRGIDWAPLVELTEYLHRAPDGFATAAEAVSSYREVLAMVGELAADEHQSRRRARGGQASISAAISAGEQPTLCACRCRRKSRWSTGCYVIGCGETCARRLAR